MPAQVKVDVLVDEHGARETLTGLDAIVNKLNGKKINISVNVPTQQITQLQNIANGFTSTGTAAISASNAITGYGERVQSTVTVVNGAVARETARFKQDAQTQIDVTRKLTKEGEQYTVKTTDNYEAIRKAGEKQWEAQQKLYAQQFAALDAKEKRQEKYQQGLQRQASEEQKILDKQTAEQEKALKAEQEASSRRIATLGRIATAAAAAFVIKETKEALNTMKDVDSELANIRKVSGESEEVIAKLGDTAYKTASKYGVAATEYLSSAAEFAKAGYKNYAQLSELAIKTQLVGDVSAETASKFLLSADAAYKMGGNIDSLSAVLDRANVIENNYATSIYKIAEGLPIVASTASMANMSIDELMAGLGTITAVTQETGRKAATAMRALILNIEGEIGTVIDEDMTITQESVKSMTDALKKYGNEAVKAAQKTGKLVDPMEAIRSLAEAFKSGDLSDQELFNILSPLGGKLRTNQLTALVTNYDMFAEMLDKVKTSAGSADREINILLETWTAKTNQLKNSWTNLVANVIDSDLIKNGLDGLRAVIDGINDLLEPKSGKENEVVNEYERLYGENGTLTKERKNLEAHLAVLNEFDKQRLEYLKAQENTLTQQVSAAHKLTQKERLSYLSESISQMGSGVYLKRSFLALSEFSKLYSEAIAEDGSKNRQQIHRALQSALAEYEEYYSIIKSLQDENVKITDKQALKFAEIYEEALKAAEKAAEDAKEEIERLGENVEDSGESLDGATNSLNNYAKAALEAAKAIEAFSDATQSSKSGNADAYRSAYQLFLEDYKAGKTDTNVVRAAADMFLPESIQEALGYDLQAMGELMASDLYQGIYNGASGNAGVDFVNYMAENMTQALDEIVNITQEADGAYKFEYASAQKLADYFNLPLGAIQALIGALDEFGVQANIGWEEADNLANALGLVGHNADKSGITLEGIARTLKEDFGYSDKTDIAKIISALDAGGYLQGILGEITPEAIGAAISAAFKEAEVDTTMDNPPELPPPDTTEWDEAKESLESVPDEQEKKVKITVTGLEQFDEFKEWLETSPEDYQVIVNDDGSITVVSGKASDLSNYLSGMEEGAYSVTVNDDGSIDVVKSQGTSLYGLLSDLEDGDFAVYVGDDGSINAITADATGLDNFLTTMGDGDYGVTVDDDGTIQAVKLDAETADTTLASLEDPVTVTVNDGQITSAEGKAETLKQVLGDMPEGTEFDLTITGDDAESLATTIGEIEGVHGVKIKEDGSVTAKVTTEAFVNVLNQCTDKNVDIKAEVTGTPETKELADEESRIESKDVSINASANTSEAESDIDKLNGTPISVSVDADTSQAIQHINALNGIPVTVHVSASGGVHGGSGGSFDGNASGTKNAPGGLSLVNELGPELISDNGRAYIANGGKPAIVNLGKGAVVLTAEETKQALGHATAYNGINAYAMGSSVELFASGTVKTGGNSGTGAEGIPGTGTSKWYDYWEDPNKKKSSSSNSDSSKSSSKWEDKEKKLKEELAALEELAEWYHNQKMHDEEGDTYQKAIEKVDALRKEYLKAGFDETAKEVTTLANKIYDYEEDVADAKAHAIEDLEDELDILESQIELAENQGDLNRMLELQNEAQKKVAKLLEAYRAAGFSDTSPEILKLANMGYDYASDSGSTMKDLWKSLIEALEDMKDTQDDANDLAEKQLAVDEAREALQNAQNQRTVRVFNPVTGQWEWVADSKSIQQAQESLTKAEESLLKEQQSQEFAALKKVMENGGSLSDVTIGPGLSALLSGASLEQTNAFASALGLLSGGLATSADTSAKSIFDSVDSHDNVTQYTFNGVTIDAATAENTTLAELTRMITPLALTTNMPA